MRTDAVTFDAITEADDKGQMLSFKNTEEQHRNIQVYINILNAF